MKDQNRDIKQVAKNYFSVSVFPEDESMTTLTNHNSIP